MIRLRSIWLQRLISRKAKDVTVFIMLCMMAPEQNAADIKEAQVVENGGVYRINVVTEIDAPAEYVHKVLTDYVHIYRLNPSIIESQILPSPGNEAARIRTRILDCIFMFCMELDLVEDVHEIHPYDLHTLIVPSLSNFLSGETRWEIEPQEERSQVIYEAQLEPDFVIFPIIGPYLVKEKLREGFLFSIARIECLAKIQEELDWDIHLDVANVNIDTLCDEACDENSGQCQQ